MTLIDELMAAAHGVERLLSGLGPRPKGDVAGMTALASAIRAEAATIATEAQAVGAIPGAVVFSGPARAGLVANVRGVSGVLGNTSSQLEHAADRVLSEARKIDREQKQWDRDRKHLQGQLSSLSAQIRSAAK